jgi:hypothetical protein
VRPDLRMGLDCSPHNRSRPLNVERGNY